MKRLTNRLSKSLAILLVAALLVQPVMSFAGTLSSEPSTSETSGVTVITDSTDEDSDNDSVIEDSNSENPSLSAEDESSIDPSIGDETNKEQPANDTDESDENNDSETTDNDEVFITKIFKSAKTLFSARAASLGKVYKTDTLKIPGCSTTCGEFEVDTADYGNNKVAFCGNHSKYAPCDEGDSIDIPKIDYIERKESDEYYYKNLYKVLYYGYGGPGSTMKETEKNWIRTSMALSRANKDVVSGNSDYDDFYDKAKEKTMPSTSFKVYRIEFGGKQDIFFWTWNPKGEVKINKDSTEGLEGVNGYTLVGAKYAIYKTKADAQKDANRVITLTTGKYGITSKVSLVAGTYYIKEVKAPPGYLLNEKITKLIVEDEDDKTVNVNDTENKGSLKVKKTSADPDIVHPYKGAKYGVYKTKANANADTKRLTTLTTNAKGETGEYEDYAGTYYVKEVYAPPGYDLDPTVHEVELIVGELNVTKVVKSKEPVEYDPIPVLLYKINKDGDRSTITGESTLEGAVFRFDFYEKETFTSAADANGKIPTKSWKFKTDEDGYIMFKDDSKYFISGSEFYKNDSGKIYLKQGSIIITEEEAPNGYLKDTTPKLAIIDEHLSYGVPVGNKLEVPIIEEQEIMGDIEVNKTDRNGEPVGSVTFDIVQKSTGKVVKTLKTDSNGYATTKDSEWPYGSLPYGTYIVKEVSYPDNYIPAGDQEVTISEHGKVIPLKFVNNKLEISTLAKATDTNSNITYASKETIITDTVTYKYARVGGEYISKGYAVDKSNGEPILNKDGTKVTASATFTATESNGTVDVTYIFDSSSLKGKSIVFMEEIYFADDEENLLAEHKDINDEGQTITFIEPTVKTTAKNVLTGTNTGYAVGTTTVTDTVEMSKLIPGHKLTLEGVVIDKSTGNVYVDSDGKEVRTMKSFTPSNGDEKITMDFNFDSRVLAGKDIVVFEYLYNEDILIAEHTDINDKDQTVSFIEPKISTSAKDKDTGKKVGFVQEKTTVLDEVTVENLIPGLEYTLKEEVILKETGEVLKDGETAVQQEKKFTAKETTEKLSVDFTFDSKELAGKEVVVMSFLYYGDELISKHTDINDKDQTVSFIEPKISTSAKDKDTGKKVGFVQEKTTVLDEVTVENLIPSLEYTLKEEVILKETGEVLKDGETAVQQEKKFTAKEATEKLSVDFTFDSKELAGKDVVVMSFLYYGDELISKHTDINDKDQTVSFIEPKISTSAKDKDTGKKVGFIQENTTVIDEVTVENLIPELEYTLKEEVVLKETGEVLKDEGQAVQQEKKFTAREATEKLSVDFTFDSKELAGKDVVVMSFLYYGDELISKHTDINDKDQTVSFIEPKISTSAKDKDTGKKVGFIQEKTTVIDEVTVENLIPELEYTLKEEVVLKETGEVLKDEGQAVQQEKKFTAKETTEKLSVDFTFDSNELAGKDVVVMSYLYYGDILISEHTDINDKDQTVTFADPKIGTTAKDKVSGTNEAIPGKISTIVDTVKYAGLTSDLEFTVKGVIMDKQTGEKFLDNGKEVTSERTFKTTADSGEVDVEFTFNSLSLIGKEVVVYEYLYYGDILISEHTDIKDEGQTIKFLEETVDVYKQDEETGANIADATMQLIDPETEEVMLEWVSDTEARHIDKLIPGKKYIIRETVTPNTYDFVTKEIEFIAGEDKTVIMDNRPIKISGQIDKRQTYFDGADQYAYTIDYRSTSNTWADEYNMIDTIDCAINKYSEVAYVKTPVANGDYDGKMNVWYKTNKTPADYKEDAEKYNACSTNPYNPRNENNDRLTDYTGWVLWKADVSTLKSEALSVNKLGLDADEYITHIAFEHGRVEKGFTTRDTGWNRESLKSTDDTAKELVTVHDETFDYDGKTYNYEPAVMYMQVVNITAATGNVEFWNTADINIFRNRGGVPDLEDTDNDRVVQKYPMGTIELTDGDLFDSEKIVQTSDPSTLIIPVIFVLASALLMAILLRRKRGGSSDENYDV